MKNFPDGKGWFIWQMKWITSGNPVEAALRAKSQGIKWIALKIHDGGSDYNLRQLTFMGMNIPGAYVDDLIQPFVDAMEAQGIEVYGWGYIYLANAKAEAAKAITRMQKFPQLKGYIVDAEKEWFGKANEAKVFMEAIRAGLPDTSIGFCSYRFPTAQSPTFPWDIALKNSDWHCPQVYWVKSHNAGEQLLRSFQELTSKKQMTFIPVGYAYQDEVSGTKPTQGEIEEFHNKAKKLGLRGEAFYSWDDAIRHAPEIETYVADLIWDTDTPPSPDPIPTTARFTGTVKSDVTLGLNVRVSPITGASVGKLLKNTAFEGDDSIVAADNKLWIHITKPLIGWIASWYTNYVDHGTSPHPVPEKSPAIPGPFEILSYREAGEGWHWPDGALDAYPAVIHTRGGEGTARFSGAWLTALRNIMTVLQWSKTWVINQGWHNKGETGTVQQVEFSHNKKWVTKVNGDGWYEYDVYYLSDPAPNLSSPIDPYRRGIMTVDYKTGHESTGGIQNSDYLLPVISIARDRTEKLRIDPKYLKPLVYLPLEAKTTARLNVRGNPSTSANILTTLATGTPITVFALQKVGNVVWGRITETGSVEGWVSMAYTNWGL